MKKVSLFVVGAFSLFLTSNVMAEVVNTSGTATPSHSATHSHSVDLGDNDEAFGYGVGADVVVYKSGHPLAEEVRIDTRYDIENEETRVFGVVKVNLFDYLQNR